MEYNKFTQAVEALLFSPEFLELKTTLKFPAPNFWKILGISRKERQISRFLAWMLNPQANHSFGDLFLANEGKLVAIVPETDAEAVLAAMRAHPLGQATARIGRVVAEHPGMVVARTSIGGSRVVDMPAGELLPRIC